MENLQKLKKESKGDGRMFKDAVDKSLIDRETIRSKMIMPRNGKIPSNGTFYNLYFKEIFPEKLKEVASKALNKTVEEVFSSKNITSASDSQPKKNTNESDNSNFGIKDVVTLIQLNHKEMTAHLITLLKEEKATTREMVKSWQEIAESNKILASTNQELVLMLRGEDGTSKKDRAIG